MYGTFMKACVAVFATMEEVTRVTDQNFNNQRIVHANGYEQRCVSVAIRKLDDIGKGSGVLQLIPKYLCKLT